MIPSNPETLLISSSRTVHRYSCPSIKHYQAGRRPVQYDGEEFAHWVDANFDPETDRHAYKRCGTCSPDVPEWKTRTRVSRKSVAGLTLSDLGRQVCDLGRLLTVAYGPAQRVTLGVDADGVHDIHVFDQSEFVWFEQKLKLTPREEKEGVRWE
ncbi:hypothetical protein AB0230_01710 [Microbacterium sp. NPDC089190]|uniref:hypothetical protein n=1 Tax=Microbacterium sp. NPDC089190 TaxID=3155063 RepID=UPI00344FB83D